MDGDKPEHHQPHDPAEQSQHADSSLVSKLARAYNSLPPEQRGASALPGSGDPVSNPELEDRFQKLLRQLEVLETYQGHRDHKPDPRVVALLEKKIQELPAQGDEFPFPDDGASARADEVASVVRGSNVGGVRGNGSTPAAGTARRGPEAVERGTEGLFRRGFRIGLLALVLTALALLVSQQWPLWRQQFFRTNWIARIFNAPRAASAAVTTAPTPAGRPANPAISVPAPQLPAAPKSSKAVPNAPPKPPALPTIIRRPLPGPVPLTSALPEMELPSSTQPEPEAPQPPPRRTRLSPAVAQGGLILKVDPEYPPVARMARVQGAVVLHAIIGEDGTVLQLQVISGNPLLAGPALNAVKNWRYRPYLVDGEAVEVETTVTVNFKGED